MEFLDWIEKLQGIGVAGLALIALYLTNRYHLSVKEEQEERHRDEVTHVRKDYQAVVDQKDSVIEGLSNRLKTAAEQSRADMERHLVRQVEVVQRLEATIQQNTAAVAGVQEALKDVRTEVRTRTQSG